MTAQLTATTNRRKAIHTASTMLAVTSRQRLRGSVTAEAKTLASFVVGRSGEVFDMVAKKPTPQET
jgi:hypothetical protein